MSDSTTQLEDELSNRYRQPRGVAQFGIEAVPEHKRDVRGLRLNDLADA